MKVFISYSSHDVATAQTVYNDMVRGGADAFQFSSSAIIGKPSWEQVLNWISESDAFIVLISQKALESKPVNEEIAHAHYRYINNSRPEKIVPAIIEKGIKPPLLVERFTTVDFLDYKQGMSLLLMDQLGLERKAAFAKTSPVTRFPLVDLGPIFQEFKTKNPEPTEAELFSKDAETVLANYDLLEPREIKGPGRAKHLDLILSGLPSTSGSPKQSEVPKDGALKDYDKWLLGYDPGNPKLVAESLLNWKPWARRTRLNAPTLTQTSTGLSWIEVLGATGYVLEGSKTKKFTSSKELYRGPETSYLAPLDLDIGLLWFRVKAVGGALMPDSGWSDVVCMGWLTRFNRRPWLAVNLLELDSTLAAPQLELTSLLGPNLTWSAVEAPRATSSSGT
jgi:TIR domain